MQSEAGGFDWDIVTAPTLGPVSAIFFHFVNKYEQMDGQSSYVMDWQTAESRSLSQMSLCGTKLESLIKTTRYVNSVISAEK